MRSRALLFATSVSIMTISAIAGTNHSPTALNRAQRRALDRISLTAYRQPISQPLDALPVAFSWRLPVANAWSFPMTTESHAGVKKNQETKLAPMTEVLAPVPMKSPAPPPPPPAPTPVSVPPALVSPAPATIPAPPPSAAAPMTAANSGTVTGHYTIPANLAPIFACIRHYESNNNYAETANPNYRGAYQFAWSTWQELGQTGDPAAAPAWLQDEMAVKLQQMDGWTPWETAPLCGV